jgi:hypothetical protein
MANDVLTRESFLAGGSFISLYLGDIDTGLFIEFPGVVADASALPYDPRSADQTWFSQPGVTPLNFDQYVQELMITFSRRIVRFDTGAIGGTAGGDVTLSSLIAALSTLRYLNGRAVILELATGSVVADPNNANPTAQTDYTSTGMDDDTWGQLVTDSPQPNATTALVVDDGSQYYVSKRLASAPFLLVFIAQHSDVLSSLSDVLTQIQNRMGAIAGAVVGTFIGNLIVIVVLSVWFTTLAVRSLNRTVRTLRDIPKFMGTSTPLPLPKIQTGVDFLDEPRQLCISARDRIAQFNASRSDDVAGKSLPPNPFFRQPLPWLLGQPQPRPITAPAGRFIPPPNYSSPGGSAPPAPALRNVPSAPFFAAGEAIELTPLPGQTISRQQQPSAGSDLQRQYLAQPSGAPPPFDAA